MEWRPASLTSSTWFERSSLFQYSNGAHLFHLLRLPPFSFNWSIRRSPRNTCSLSVAFAPHASSVTALYSPRENFLPRTNLGGAWFGRTGPVQWSRRTRVAREP